MNPMDTRHRRQLHEAQFAFPHQRKRSIHGAAHVCNAVARFDQAEVLERS